MSAQRETIIRVENFTAAYDGEVVLENVNFEVFTGEIFSILGSSGSGKSTLLKHMIGLYKPAAGRMCLMKKGSAWTCITSGNGPWLWT